MSDLVVSNYELLLAGQHLILLLVACHNHLDTLLEILLVNSLSSCLDCTKRCLINHVGKLCSRCTRAGLGDILKAYIACHLNLGCMYLKYINSSLHIRKLDRHTSVETSRSKQCRIKCIRLVGCRKHYDALGSVEAVHLGKQLVKSLFSLVVAAEAVAASLLADSIYLVYENDTGCLFLSLLEEVSDLGSSHTYKHLNKL